MSESGVDDADAELSARQEAALYGDQSRGADVDGTLPRTSDTSDREIERVDDDSSEVSPVYDLIQPQVHECNAKLLFTPFNEDDPVDGLKPYFDLVGAWEPDLDGAGPFGAVGTQWDFDLKSDHRDPDNYGKSVNRYWKGKIESRDGDSGDAYFEYQIPVYDTSDEKRNRRINFQFRPALPEATNVDTGDRIRSLPADLPEGVRVQMQASNVEPVEAIDVLQALASELGIQASYFARSAINEWSRITGLAYYVRVLRGAVDELVIGHNGLMDRLAQFGRQREGRGELKWDNSDVFGKRHAAVLGPEQLSALYGDHTVAKLLKSYLTKHASEEAGPPDTNPTDHPKIEVQYNLEYSNLDGHIPWFSDHHDDYFGHATLSANLQAYLINALEWAGLPRDPNPDLYVADDHFQPERMDDELADDLELVDDPIETTVEQERDLVTSELIDKAPTDSEKDILRTAADGGRFDTLNALADDADVSTSTASRCVQKFSRLFDRLDGLQLADDVVRDRVQELLVGLEERLDTVHAGLDRLSSGTETVDEDSALGRWAARWGVQFRESARAARDQLKIVISGGNLTQQELLKILRHGYDAANATGAADPARFASAEVAYYTRDGEKRDVGEWVGVNQGGRTRILGKRDVDALH